MGNVGPINDKKSPSRPMCASPIIKLAGHETSKPSDVTQLIHSYHATHLEARMLEEYSVLRKTLIFSYYEYGKPTP